RDVLSVIEELNELPLAGVLVTAVHREGRLAGTDLFLMEDVAERSAHPVIASGGIATMNDLRQLVECGVSGAVIGMALYTGASTRACSSRSSPSDHGDSAMSVVVRETRETRVHVELIRGAGAAHVETGERFLDHMLSTLARYA